MWRELNAKQRLELLHRKIKGESIEVLSKETGMNPITLNRRLQELRVALSGEPEEEAENRVKTETPDKNHLVISVDTERIWTVEQLLAAAKVDLTIWEVERHVINKWETARRSERKNLTWADGTIQEGRIEDDGTMFVEPLIQVKIWLVRKKAVAVEPVIHPVAVNYSYDYTESKHSANDIKMALIVPDTQVGFSRDLVTGKLTPFHDRAAMDAICQIAESYEFSKIVLLGDMLDLPDWSEKFLHSPQLTQVTQPALEELAWWLLRLRTANPTADMDYIEGNHEIRLVNSVIRFLPQAYGLRPVNMEASYPMWSLPNLLALDKLGITWHGDYPNGEVWINDQVSCVHGLELSADKAVRASEVSVIFGHIHRLEQSSRALYYRGGYRSITAICPGFLGKIDGAVPGRKNNQNWSQGAAVVYYQDNGNHSIVHIPVSRGTAIFDGMLWEGKDTTKFLKKDVKGYNF